MLHTFQCRHCLLEDSISFASMFKNCPAKLGMAGGPLDMSGLNKQTLLRIDQQKGKHCYQKKHGKQAFIKLSLCLCVSCRFRIA
jgi:hypothetical protein